MSSIGKSWDAAMEFCRTSPGESPENIDQIKAGILAMAQPTTCGATAVFWPDVEACEAECILPARHGGTVHEDEVLGEWDESELNTHLCEE